MVGGKGERDSRLARAVAVDMRVCVRASERDERMRCARALKTEDRANFDKSD